MESKIAKKGLRFLLKACSSISREFFLNVNLRENERVISCLRLNPNLHFCVLI